MGVVYAKKRIVASDSCVNHLLADLYKQAYNAVMTFRRFLSLCFCILVVASAATTFLPFQQQVAVVDDTVLISQDANDSDADMCAMYCFIEVVRSIDFQLFIPSSLLLLVVLVLVFGTNRSPVLLFAPPVLLFDWQRALITVTQKRE